MNNIDLKELSKYYRVASDEEYHQNIFDPTDPYFNTYIPEIFTYYPNLKMLGWAILHEKYQNPDNLMYHNVCIVYDKGLDDTTLMIDFGHALRPVFLDELEATL